MCERAATRSLLHTAAVTLLLVVAVRAEGSAQSSVGAMADECAGANPLLRPICLEGALALEAARGGVGLATTQGMPVPGSTSTIGRRLGSSPRLAFSGRAGLTRVGMPDPRAGTAPAGRHSFSARTLAADITVGVLDGFSLLPTVGGFFSLDLLASGSAVMLSDASGFEGSIKSLGYGVRVGILRESFTLPGVSASVMRRHLGDAAWGKTADLVSLTFDPTATSVRVTAGKDLLAFGVAAGWGWDRYCGDSALTARRTVAGVTTTGTASSGGFASDRQVFFGGLSYTFLVLQLSAEGGYGTGWATPPGRAAGGYDPTQGSLFGSVAARLTW